MPHTPPFCCILARDRRDTPPTNTALRRFAMHGPKDEERWRQLYEYGIRTPQHCRDREETGCIRPAAHARVVAFHDDVNGQEVVVEEYIEHEERWAVCLVGSDDSFLVKPSQLRVNAKQPDGIPSAEEWLQAHGGGKVHTPAPPPFRWENENERVASLLSSTLLRMLIPPSDILVAPGKLGVLAMSWAGILSGVGLGGCFGWAHWQALHLVSSYMPSGLFGGLLTLFASLFWYYNVDDLVDVLFLPDAGPMLEDQAANVSSLVVVPAIACFAAGYLSADNCCYLLLSACASHHMRRAHVDFGASRSAKQAKIKQRFSDDPEDKKWLEEVISAGIVPIVRLGVGLGTALKMVAPLRATLLGVVALWSYNAGLRCFAKLYGACFTSVAGVGLFWYCSG